LLSVAGGKYTTYRHMAEVITDAILARISLRRRERTRRQPLDGTPPEAWADFQDRAVPRLRQAGLQDSSARHLVHRYGQRAIDVMEYVKRDAALMEKIHPDEPDIRAELAYQHEHEMAVFPDDFLLRRTRVGLFHPELLSEARARGTVLDSWTRDINSTLPVRPRLADPHPGPAIIAS
jgi:glycerol-3-phosphate dehydrogenase